MTFDIILEPKNAKLIALLYAGYRVSYDEMLKELDVKKKELESILKATDGYWETPMPKSYRLTEKGRVAYGVIKSRNVKIKRIERKPESKSKFLSSLKKKILGRFS
ncbi:MAG: hypothetical protein V3R86_03855 [Candidatus Hydrothermarchaeaceae archaeon]